MGRRRVAPGAELVEVAAAAERRTGPVEDDAHARVRLGDGQRVQQRVAHGGVVGVAHRRPVERDVQDGAAVALPPHPQTRAVVPLPDPRRAPAVEPGQVLGPELQQRVGGRLGHQALGDRAALGPPQQERQRGGGQRVGVDRGRDAGRRGVVADHDVDEIRPRDGAGCRRPGPRRHADDHDR